MNVELHTLAWPNIDPRMIAAHQRVCSHFGLDVRYTHEYIQHDQWMQDMVARCQADAIGFMDIDCIQSTRHAVDHMATYLTQKLGYFIGPAQASNHLPDTAHIFAAPSFLFISKSMFMPIQMNNLFMRDPDKNDVAQGLTRYAEENRYPHQLILPRFYEDKANMRSTWRLHNFGTYGTGTLYGNTCYHLFQGRCGANVELFERRCDEIIRGGIDTSRMMLFNFQGWSR